MNEPGVREKRSPCCAAFAPKVITRITFFHDKRDLAVQIVATANAERAQRGLPLQEVAAMNATLIELLSSTKSPEGKRDLEMYLTTKGNQWNFGLKAHIRYRCGRQPFARYGGRRGEHHRRKTERLH
ncbi:hypothetical protein [Thiomonas sp.]